jgi:serine/threonine protein kinase
MNRPAETDVETVLDALAAWDERYRRGEDPAVGSLGLDDPDLVEDLRRRIEKLKRLYAALKRSDLAADSAGEISGPLPAFPGYELLSKIGQGGMGVVYKARDLRLGRVVAIKTIAECHPASPAQLDRFRLEAESVARLKHPNVIPIYTIGEHLGRPFYALEYADGGSLAQRLADGPMGTAPAAGMIEALAGAVHAAHLAGIVHRDLKPSNVLLSAEGVPKIGDFGVAKLMDSDSVRTLSGETLGTPSYMAPEQAEGQSQAVGPAADVYALGAILYQALTGKPPFLGQTSIETLKLVVSAEVLHPRRLRPDVPRDLETICLKCLEKAPAKRYATALELAVDLRRFQQGEPVRARRIGPLRRVSKWARRRPWQTALLATLAAGASAFVALSIRYNVQLRTENHRTEAKAAEARRNYLEARSTIQAMLGHFRAARLAGSPGLIDLRRDQGEDALGFYDRILRQVDSTDPVVLADAIRALSEASHLQYVLGHPDRAEKAIRRALDLITVLRERSVDDLETLTLHVDCLMKLGGYLEFPRRQTEAWAIYEQVIPLAERLMRARNDAPLATDVLAACHHTYASLLTPDRNDLAKVHSQTAIELRERPLVLALPGMRGRLAQSIVNLGVIHWQEHDFAQAETRFRRAEELLLTAAADVRQPDPDSAFSLGQLNVNWVGLLWETQKYDQAIARANGALDRLESYLRLEPNHQLARDICLKLHANRAQALAARQRHKEAADDWGRVLELSTEPVPPNYRIVLAFEFLQCGELDRAIAQARLAREAVALSGEDLYNLGCLFSRAAAAAGSHQRGKGEERSGRLESYVADALSALQKAAAAGYFRDPAVRELAGKDHDLDFVRDRREFRRIFDTAAGGHTSIPRRFTPCWQEASGDTIGFRPKSEWRLRAVLVERNDS